MLLVGIPFFKKGHFFLNKVKSCAIYSIQVAMWLLLKCNSRKKKYRHRRCQLRLVISLIKVMVGNKQKCNK